MAIKSKAPEISLLEWKDLHKARLRFPKDFFDKNWVVNTPYSLAIFYIGVLGNLTSSRIEGRASLDLVRAMLHEGLEKSAFDRLKMMAGVPAEELGRAVNIPVRTLARKQRFKPDESERILRVAACFQRALEVMGGIDRARKWFSNPKRALGGRTPLEYCDTDPGAEAVRHLLGRIEHGVFT